MYCSRCSTSPGIGISTVASIIGVVPWIFPNYLNKKFLIPKFKMGITALCAAVVYSQVAGALSPKNKTFVEKPFEDPVIPAGTQGKTVLSTNNSLPVSSLRSKQHDLDDYHDKIGQESTNTDSVVSSQSGTSISAEIDVEDQDVKYQMIDIKKNLPSFTNKKINESNIGKLPVRMSGVLPDIPGHPAYRDLIHILAPYQGQKHDLIKAIEDDIDTRFSTRLLTFSNSSAFGNLERIKIFLKRLILFLREPTNEKYRGVFFNLIDEMSKQCDSFQKGFEMAILVMKQNVCLPQLPEGPPPLKEVLSMFDKFCKGLDHWENYKKSIDNVLNVGDEEVKKCLQHILVKLGDPVITDENKQLVLMGLGDKFSECMPSWMEESRAVLEELYGSDEKCEDLLLRMAKRMREQIVLQFADKGQWHVLNYLRGSKDFSFGLDCKDIGNDWHSDSYVVEDLRGLQEKCLQAYTVEALVCSVYSQLLYSSGRDKNRMIEEILYPFVEKHPKLYGGEGGNDDEFWEKGDSWIRAHLLESVFLTDKKTSTIINLQGVAYMLEAIGLITGV